MQWLLSSSRLKLQVQRIIKKKFPRSSAMIIFVVWPWRSFIKSRSKEVTGLAFINLILWAKSFSIELMSFLLSDCFNSRRPSEPLKHFRCSSGGASRVWKEFCVHGRRISSEKKFTIRNLQSKVFHSFLGREPLSSSSGQLINLRSQC